MFTVNTLERREAIMEQKDYVVEDTVIETEKKDQSAEVLTVYAKKLAEKEK